MTREGSTADVDAGTPDGPDRVEPAALEADLRERREPFVRATVVRREPPVSATVGDRAVVTAAGDLHGWIGGVACAQRAVTREALAALEDGEPRLLGLAPDPESIDRPGMVTQPMTCHSEGTLEVFVEPVVPTASLVVVGDTPIARSLRRLADELAFEVLVVDPDADADVADDRAVVPTADPETVAASIPRGSPVVVASMGACDARGVAAGVLADASYVGLVASGKRAAEVTARAGRLLERDPESIEEAVTSPAGVDIDARNPAEIAVSVLAEVVDVAGAGTTVDAGSSTEGPAAEADDAGETEADLEPETATDPVCGMAVDVDDPGATVDLDGGTYYFCCPGCAESFRAEPGAYVGEGSPEAS